MTTPHGGNLFRRSLDGADLIGAPHETPVDLAAVQADDALLNTLGVVDDFDEWLAGANAALIARQARHFDVEVELERVKRAAACGGPLVAWRRDVETEPIGAELADTDTALAAIRAGKPPAGYEPPRLVSPIFVGIAAALALIVGVALLILAMVT